MSLRPYRDSNSAFTLEAFVLLPRKSLTVVGFDLQDCEYFYALRVDPYVGVPRIHRRHITIIGEPNGWKGRDLTEDNVVWTSRARDLITPTGPFATAVGHTDEHFWFGPSYQQPPEMNVTWADHTQSNVKTDVIEYEQFIELVNTKTDHKALISLELGGETYLSLPNTDRRLLFVKNTHPLADLINRRPPQPARKPDPEEVDLTRELYAETVPKALTTPPEAFAHGTPASEDLIERQRALANKAIKFARMYGMGATKLSALNRPTTTEEYKKLFEQAWSE